MNVEFRPTLVADLPEIDPATESVAGAEIVAVRDDRAHKLKTSWLTGAVDRVQAADERVARLAAATDDAAAAAAAAKSTVEARASEVASNAGQVATNAATVAVAKIAAVTSADKAAASEINAGLAASQVAGLRGTSTTPVTIAASGGEVALTTQAGKLFYPGTPVWMASTAAPVAANITGIVKSYAGTSLVVAVQAASGVGTAVTDLSINVLGGAVVYPAARDPALFAYNRYRDLVDDWRALGIQARITTLMIFA